MKKILTIITTMILALVLVACGNDGVTPEIREADKVELTKEAVVEKINELEFDFTTLNMFAEFSFNLDLTDVDTELDITSTIKASGSGEFNVYLDNESNVVANVDADASISVTSNSEYIINTDTELDVQANLYFVADEARAYLDIDGNFKSGPMTIGLEGKYQQPVDVPEELALIFDEINNFEINPQDLEALLNDPEFEKLLEENDFITFYEGSNYFGIKLNINKEVLLSQSGIFAESGITEADLEMISELDIELSAVFVNNKVAEITINALVDVQEGDITFNLTLNAGLKFGVEMPKLPNFTDYEEESFENILSGIFPM